MVTILISPAFVNAALIRGEVLIRREVLISLWISKGVALIRRQRLLEEIMYLFFSAMKFHTMACVLKKETNFTFVR